MREPYGRLVEFISTIIVVVALVGWMGGVFDSPHGTAVRPAKQWYEVRVEADKDRELLGNF